jgi:hypothetical protein
MDTSTQQMLSLLRSSLNGTTPDSLPQSTEDWEKLFRLARKHGVVTMINDAIEHLPDEQQPQGDIALSWSLSADRTRYHYNHQAEVLQSIRQKADAQGLRLGLIKGMSLSRYYPIPSSRACGDIDIFFLPLSKQNYRQGNILLGCPDAELDGKHAEVSVDGVPVENHYRFLDLNYLSQYRAERYIHSSLKDVSPEGYLSPMGNMAYLLMHTVSHLTAKYKLPLRNIIDWGMFLKANSQALSPADCHRVMRRIGMLPAFDILTLLAGEFIGADLSQYISATVRQEDVDRMRELILDKKYFEPVPSGLNPVQRFRLRWKRNQERRWLYRYLPSSAAERVIFTIKHIFIKG